MPSTFCSTDDSIFGEPLDRELWAVPICTDTPGEVSNLVMQADRETLTWTPIPRARHEVLHGLLSELLVGHGAWETALAQGAADQLGPSVIPSAARVSG